MMWVRALESLSIQPVPGSENGFFPFWSPDSRSVAFFADGKLKKVEIDGGPAQVLCDITSAAGGTWNADGVIVLGNPRGPLLRVSASGGEAKPLTTLDASRLETAHVWPQFLPDGRHFIYRLAAQGNGAGVYVGSLDANPPRLILSGPSAAQFAPPGYLLFNRQETLMGIAFDPKELATRGEPFPVAEQVGSLLSGASAFSVSETGVLVYRGPVTSNVQLGWFNRDGKRLATPGETGLYRQIALSPDEKRVALARLDPKVGTYDIWLLELESGIFSRVTLSPANDDDAVWSPDGRKIFFSSNRTGIPNIYAKTLGGGEDELVYESAEAKYCEASYGAGQFLLFLSQRGKTLYSLPLAGERKPTVLFKTDFESDEPHPAPDGRWVVYSSNESGRWEVYTAAFPSFTERRQVSSGGGNQPQWRRDGREIFYLGLDGKLMAVDVKPGTTLETGAPQALFLTTLRPDPTLDQYCVTGDGHRFLLAEPVEEAAKPITVILNWDGTLGK